MKFSFPTVVTLITVLVSASAESTFLRGDSMNHEDDTNFNHRELIPGDYSILSGDAEVMVKEEETSASKQDCLADGHGCTAFDGGCNNCCNGSHLGDRGLWEYCGPQTSCWGKDTLCVPAVGSCDKCCNSWSWYGPWAYCD